MLSRISSETLKDKCAHSIFFIEYCLATNTISGNILSRAILNDSLGEISRYRNYRWIGVGGEVPATTDCEMQNSLGILKVVFYSHCRKTSPAVTVCMQRSARRLRSNIFIHKSPQQRAKHCAAKGIKNACLYLNFAAETFPSLYGRS
jgi:hypothetical protein